MIDILSDPPNPVRASFPRSVLIVDDDQRTAQLLSRWIRTLGHTVAGMAASGKEAIALAHKIDFDLLILDMNMPGMDGVEALRLIRAIREVPVIFSTAVADGPALARILQASPDSYLVKPFSPAQLNVAIQRVVSNQNAMGADCPNRKIA
jgi:CheY-like chemotaxis protein